MLELGLFRVQTRHKPVFDLMGIAQNIPLIEMERVREIVHACNQTVRRHWLNDVFPLPSQKFAIENSLQYRSAHFHRSLKRVAVRWIVHIHTVYEPLGVIGIVQRESWTE